MLCVLPPPPFHVCACYQKAECALDKLCASAPAALHGMRAGVLLRYFGARLVQLGGQMAKLEEGGAEEEAEGAEQRMPGSYADMHLDTDVATPSPARLK